jgi:hypothetical protein
VSSLTQHVTDMWGTRQNGQNHPPRPLLALGAIKEHQQMDKVCGTGAACENHCPVMLLGRLCPDPLDLVLEIRAAQLSPAA